MAGPLALSSSEPGQVRKEAATAMKLSAEDQTRHPILFSAYALIACLVACFD